MHKIESLEHTYDGQPYLHKTLTHRNDQPASEAVVVIPNYMGVLDSSIALAEPFIGPTTEALILDVYGANRRPADTDVAASMCEAVLSRPRHTVEHVKDAIATYLKTRTSDSIRISLVGFCFGGSVALDVARSGYPMNGVVALHAGLSTRLPADALSHKTKILTVQGSADPLVPPQQISEFHQEMNRFDIEWQLVILGGLYHAFTDPNANTPGIARYDEKGRNASFRLAKEFLWS